VAGAARKLVLLRRSGRASVVFHDGWRWAAVEGPARLEGPDDRSARSPQRPVAPILRAVFSAAGGTHDDWSAFDRVMAEERRCAVFVGMGAITGNG
jgi:hypothetical protein